MSAVVSLVENGMFEAPLALLKLLRIVLMDVPQRFLAFLASCVLGLTVWLHRRHRAVSQVTGSHAAATILAKNQLGTKVYRIEGWLVDGYYPKRNAILLSANNFDSMTIGALSIASHEVGHVLQARRWYVPYWLSWLLARPAQWALAISFWLWLIGAAAEDQEFVLAGVGCFAFYLIYMVLELLCEIDASRRGVRELLRHGFLQENESRVARRILRAALGTYLAAFAGAGLALTFLLPQIHWRNLLGNHPEPVLAAPAGKPQRKMTVLPAKVGWQPIPIHIDNVDFRDPSENSPTRE